jgi:hypothetical protein
MTAGLLKLGAVAAALAIAGGLAVAAQGCTVLVNDTPPDDASTGVSSCSECQYQTCIGQWAVCGQSAECMAIYTCATAPGCDQNCIDQCYRSHAQGQASYYALASCDLAASQSTQCTTFCNASADGGSEASGDDSSADAPVESGDDGGDAAPPDDSGPEAGDDASTPPDAGSDGGNVQTCTDCASQNCAAEKAACAPGSACDRYTGCIAGCTTSACVTQCGTDNPDGMTASGKLGDCVSAHCSRECGLAQ